MLTIPTPSHRNPWLTEIVPLALTHPHGTSLTADALRLSILSFAAFDIGFRMARRTAPDVHHSGTTTTGFSTEGEDIIELKTRGERSKGEQDNAMYELSRVQRRRALELLDVARIAGQLGRGKEEGVEMDLALATALILSIRDVSPCRLIVPARRPLTSAFIETGWSAGLERTNGPGDPTHPSSRRPPGLPIQTNLQGKEVYHRTDDLCGNHR
jgi:hypothetical protein